MERCRLRPRPRDRTGGLGRGGHGRADRPPHRRSRGAGRRPPRPGLRRPGLDLTGAARASVVVEEVVARHGHVDVLVDSAGKFALEGLSIAPAQEVASLGVKVLIAQPGAMRTGFAGAPISESARIPGYDETVGDLHAHVADVAGRQPGDPAKIAAATLTALDAPGTPLRPAFGDDTFDRLTAAAKRARGAGFDEQ